MRSRAREAKRLSGYRSRISRYVTRARAIYLETANRPPASAQGGSPLHHATFPRGSATGIPRPGRSPARPPASLFPGAPRPIESPPAPGPSRREGISEEREAPGWSFCAMAILVSPSTALSSYSPCSAMFLEKYFPAASSAPRSRYSCAILSFKSGLPSRYPLRSSAIAASYCPRPVSFAAKDRVTRRL